LVWPKKKASAAKASYRFKTDAMSIGAKVLALSDLVGRKMKAVCRLKLRIGSLLLAKLQSYSMAKYRTASICNWPKNDISHFIAPLHNGCHEPQGKGQPN
jgi:hypothetical protein